MVRGHGHGERMPSLKTSAAAGWYSSFMSGLERRKSAVERLHAIGMLQTTVIRSSALTFDVVWLGFEGVPEEDDEVDATFGDRGSHLLVAAQRPAQEAIHGQLELSGDQRTGCAGRIQLMSGERSAIEAGPLDEIGFAIVVGDQCDALAERHHRRPIHTRTLASTPVERSIDVSDPVNSPMTQRMGSQGAPGLRLTLGVSGVADVAVTANCGARLDVTTRRQ
jgi:hypothetical protein